MASHATTQPQAAPADKWLVLIGALQIQVILGVVYGFSALVEPVKHQFPTWTNQDVQWANTLALLFFAIMMVPAGRLQDRMGPKLPALLGAQALFFAFLLAATIRSPQQKMLWWLSYGVLYGVGIGLAYVCPIAALVKWFPERKGLITGIAVAGFGGGSALFIPTVSAYFAPQEVLHTVNGAATAIAEGHTVSDFFLIHALICGVLCAVGALLMANPPAPAATPAAATAAAKPNDLDWRQMLATPKFWLLWLMFVGSATAGLMTISVVKVAVKEVSGITPAQAAFAGSVLALLNALGRVFWGAVSDKVGREPAMIAMFGLQTVAMFLVTPLISTGAMGAYVIMGLVGLNFGGNFALFPSATADAFGIRNLGMNYGWVFTAYGAAGVIGPQVAAYFKDVQKTYAPAFIVAGVLVGIATGLAVVNLATSRKRGE